MGLLPIFAIPVGSHFHISHFAKQQFLHSKFHVRSGRFWFLDDASPVSSVGRASDF